ncbi:MAG: hypothetical protein ACSHXK_04130 [Oceanococcus sp.]
MRPSRALLRLLALLTVCFGVIGLSPLGISIVALCIAAWVLLLQRPLVNQLVQRIWRMRWFFLAIGILYGLGSPVEEKWLALEQGFYRVGVLIVLVSSVGLCLSGLASQELAHGLVRLLRPLSYLKLPIASFARRLALALSSVDLMDQKIRSMPRKDRHQALNSVAQVCWAAENWLPLESPVESAERPAEVIDVSLFLFLAVLVVGSQCLS